MKFKAQAPLLALSVTAICLNPTSGSAAGDGRCRDIGGGVLTNFLDQTHAQGPLTGDLRGAVAVEVLGVNGTVYHISKQLVTDTGDTVNFSNTDLTTYATGVSGLVAAEETINIIGGTGRFDGATGTLSFFGAINGSEVILRYDGTVCFRPSSAG